MNQIAKTRDDEQDTQNSGKETRLENQPPEGKKPQPPKYLSDNISVMSLSYLDGLVPRTETDVPYPANDPEM
jgi:hypothetical protein